MDYLLLVGMALFIGVCWGGFVTRLPAVVARHATRDGWKSVARPVRPSGPRQPCRAPEDPDVPTRLLLLPSGGIARRLRPRRRPLTARQFVARTRSRTAPGRTPPRR
jgi:hypothetical protein